MRLLKPFSFAAIIMIWVLAIPLHAALTQPAMVLPQPDASLLPQQVVGIVIAALALNDQPHIDAGIETTFNFASPENRVNTGPLAAFTRMVKTPPYGLMLNHLKSDLSEVVHVGDSAYVLVQLTAREGSEAVFAFRLSKQIDGQYRDMWMTDAVWPVSKSHSF